MMKTNLILILLFAFIAENTFAQKPIKLSGTLSNKNADSFLVTNKSSRTFTRNLNTQYAKVDDKGNFSITIPSVEEYNTIVLQNGKSAVGILAQSGASIVLAGDMSKLESGVNVVSGSKIEVTQFDLKLMGEKPQIKNFGQTAQQLSANEPEAYTKALDSAKNDALQYLKANQANLPKSYIEYFNDFLKYSAYNATLVYPIVHEMIAHRSNNIGVIAPEKYNIALSVPKDFNDKLLAMEAYQQYTEHYYFIQLASKGVLNNPNEAGKATIQTDSTLLLLQQNAPPKSAALAVSSILNQAIKGYEPEQWEKHYQALVKKYPKDENVLALTKMRNELKKFDKGMPAVDFEFTTLEGKKMKLSDLKGKVVYLDFWASWCGPCRQQMPAAKELKKHYEGKDVVFLYISIDDTDEKWLKGIESMSIEGIHARSSGWSGPISTLYKVSSIPAYFLIDKKGNFSERPPRPSQKEEVIKLIDSLLQKG